MQKRQRRRRRTALGSVSKQDFAAVAGSLCRAKCAPGLADDLADYFAKQNPRFNRARFIEATKKC